MTARDCRDVDSAARVGFIESGPLQPAEKRLARSSGERLSPCAFHLSGGLANEHDTRRNRERDDRRHAGIVAAASA
jgi:hypothetical protein